MVRATLYFFLGGGAELPDVPTKDTALLFSIKA